MRSLIALVTMPFLAYAGAAPLNADAIRVSLENRYCTPNEKVGSVLKKKVPKPGMSAVREMPSTEISAPEMAALKTIIIRDIPNPDFLSVRVWDYEDDSKVTWRIASVQVDGQEKTSRGNDYSFCRVNAVWNRTMKQQPSILFAPCAHSVNSRAQTFVSEALSAGAMLQPFDVIDIDGDGKKEVVLQEVAGYSSTLRIYRPSKKGWTLLATGCASSD